MKKYTIVYGDCFTRGSMRGSIIKYKYIEVDNLKEWMDTNEEVGPNSIWFIFEGHCVEEGSK